MFNSLTGTITGKLPQKIFLDTNGIEWDIQVPDSAVSSFPAIGEKGKVYTWLQHTDAAMSLFGFATDKDRSLFFDLLKVDGIGPKGALKIMASVSTSDLARILDEGNIDALQKVPGVGKKTAAKMLLQLKGKLSFVDEGTKIVRVKEASAYEDVIVGLVGMGYERKNAEQVVSNVAAQLENDDNFTQMSASDKESAIFRRALVELA